MMSKTFQEAILAARKLGIQYLWIDSLCIGEDETSFDRSYGKSSAYLSIAPKYYLTQAGRMRMRRLYDDDAV